MTGPSPAVVLLSGGLDSAVAAACARRDGFAPRALTIDYNQRHRAELDAARRVAQSLCIDHRIVGVDLRAIGGSALTDDIEVPKEGTDVQTHQGPRGPTPSAAPPLGRWVAPIPPTYVPARNLTFLSIAAGYAETIGADNLFIGVNAVDYSGYPDCRPEFIRSFQQTVNLATRAGDRGRELRVRTPLIELPKADIIRLGTDLGVDFSLTHSCYDPVGSLACGRCDSCLFRRRGFEEAGVPDPTPYAQASPA